MVTDSKKHLASIFKFNTSPVPWQHMILCGIATCIPLVVGAFQGHLGLSVYGAILGYLVALNDHFGKLSHRLVITNLTYLIIISGFALGLFFGSGLAHWIFLVCLSYWLGVLSGEGAEMEKAFLFASLGFVIAQSTPQFSSDLFYPLGLDIVFGYLSLMIAMPFLTKVGKQKPKPFKGIVESMKKTWTRKIENHIHAFSYAVTVFLAAFLTEKFNVERGYWVTITVLLVMRPDRTQSVYITLQRLIGTLLGVLVAEGVIHSFDFLTALVVGVAICAAAVPWASVKNYLLVAFFATIMVVFLLELNMHQQLDTHLPWVRLHATVFGCALSLFGSLIAKSLDLFLLKKEIRN